MKSTADEAGIAGLVPPEIMFVSPSCAIEWVITKGVEKSINGDCSGLAELNATVGGITKEVDNCISVDCSGLVDLNATVDGVPVYIIHHQMSQHGIF